MIDKKKTDQMEPADVLWYQYDAFNYPKAEDIAKRHCKKGNPNWPSFTVEEWKAGIEKAKRRAKEIDFDIATRLLHEPQRIHHEKLHKENNRRNDDDGYTDYPDGLMAEIDKANKDFNLNHRNIIMRYICDRSGIPNLQTLRSFIDTQR